MSSKQQVTEWKASKTEERNRARSIARHGEEAPLRNELAAANEIDIAGLSRHRGKAMATVTIPVEAKVIFHRPDGTIEEYIFKGGNPLEWEDVQGGRHTHVLEEPYVSIQIVNP